MLFIPVITSLPNVNRLTIYIFSPSNTNSSVSFVDITLIFLESCLTTILLSDELVRNPCVHGLNYFFLAIINIKIIIILLIIFLGFIKS